MDSIRKWLYKPKRDDKSLLAQFFYSDEDLNMVANELDSFDGRKDPERCTSLVNQLRQSQDKVLTITNAIMDVLIGDERANRDFRVKFPEDVLQENLAGQLWFGAECLAAGSSIMNREIESTAMRPLARAVTKSLENVRNLLRDTCLRNNTPNGPIRLDTNELVTEMLIESLKIFDRLFAEFELAYVSAMVPVKSTQEYELQELIGVLFSETLQRALKMKLLTQEMVDDCDPALMFTIPRLAIVSGLIIFSNGPLCIDKSVEEMSEMFRPFRTLLHKIRSLLWLLDNRELYMLEKLLCDNEQIGDIMSVSDVEVNSELNTFFNQFYNDYPLSKEYTNSFEEEKIVHGGTTKRTTVISNDLQRNENSIDAPSTSGYLIPNSIVQNTLLVSANGNHLENIDSPPDRDSLEVISVAAATLSSILTSCDKKHHSNQTSDNNKEKLHNENRNIESPNDSGICTENTSLDRSPSLDLNDLSVNNSPRKRVNQQAEHSPGTSRMLPKSAIMSRKRNKRIVREREDDCSSTGSSDTSSFNSNCVDDGEIALAMQAAEIASRNEIRARYRSSEDLLHRLFVCIAGVADQLQTNFACDLRNILKSVFLINASSDTAHDLPPKSLDTSSLDSSIEYHPPEEDVIETNEFSVDPNILAQEALFDTNVYFHLDSNQCENSDYTNHPRQSNGDDRSLTSLSSDLNRYASLREDVANLHDDETIPQHHHDYERPPIWIPDVEAPKCMSCSANFTVVKRRHHCRNCGKVFCSRCSSNSVPLPKFGHIKPVRVCNKCFIYNLTPFTM